jgi:hypothetical protein
MGALREEIDTGSRDTDYVLDGSDYVWITVGNVSINISRRENGVSVMLYPLGREMNDCIAETWMAWEEGDLDSIAK